MKKYIPFIFILITGCSEDSSVKRNFSILLEAAYFEGQKDAINGDIRVKYDSINNKYYWIKSPWDSQDPYYFNPNIPLEQQMIK